MDEKEIVSKEETFDKLEIRLGRVINVEEVPTAPKKAYKMKVNFGNLESGQALGDLPNTFQKKSKISLF